jgi:hypothetical protein
LTNSAWACSSASDHLRSFRMKTLTGRDVD